MMGDLGVHLAIPRCVQQFVTKNNKIAVLHPPDSPHPTLSDSFLFPRMKKARKGKCSADVEEVKREMAEALKRIKINKFKNYFEQWEKSLDRHIASNR